MTNKNPTTIDEQIQVLYKKKLIIESYLDCKNFLSNINYYRFSWYTKAFEENNIFNEEISFSKIKAIYILDQKLRGLIFEAIERIEIAMRTKLVNSICLDLETNNPKKKIEDILIKKISEETDENRKKTIKNLKTRFNKRLEYKSIYIESKTFQKYLSKNFLNLANENKGLKRSKKLKELKEEFNNEEIPFWCFAEKMMFSDIENLYNLLSSVTDPILKKIADQISFAFLLEPSELNSFISSLRIIRNTVSHYDKLFNVKFTFSAKKNTKFKLEKNNYLVNHYKIISYLLNHIHPNNSWKIRFDQLMLGIDNETNLSKSISSYYGFPDNYFK